MGRDNNYFTHSSVGGYKLGRGDLEKLSRGNEKLYQELLVQYEKGNRDWEGSCHGLSAVMLLNNTGKLNASSYLPGIQYFCGIREMNAALKKQITYYQLSQYCNLDTTYAGSDTIGSNIKSVLKQLVAICQKTSNPIQLSLTFSNNVGHSVLAIGCEEHGDEYWIKIADCNNSISQGRSTIKSYLKIPKDYKIKKAVYEPGYSTASWGTLIGVGYQTASSYDAIGTYKTQVEKQDTFIKKSVLRIGADTPVTVTNEKGETLAYDGSSISGTMKVSNIYTIDSAAGDSGLIYCLEVPYSDTYKVNTPNKKADISIVNDKLFAEVEATGTSKITFSSADGISMEGSGISQASYLRLNENKDSDVVSSSGKVGKSFSMEEENGQVVVQGDSLKGTTMNTINGLETSKKTIKRNASSFGVTIDKNGISSIAALKEGMTYTSGSLKYKVTKLTSKTKTVAVTAPKSKSVTSIKIPDTVTIQGKKFKVTAVAEKAFK